MGHILLVADRKTTIDSLVEVLGRGEDVLTVASSQRRAQQLARQVGPDLVVVDMTVKLNGERLCTLLRRQTEAPIIVLLREAPADGQVPPDADAWLVKPFSSESLRERVRRLMRGARYLHAGRLTLDLRDRHLRVGEAPPRRLTPKQFALLRCLMSRPGETITRAELMQEVWKTDFLDDTRTLDVHIRWLREAIEPEPNQPLFLQTVRGVGYKLQL